MLLWASSVLLWASSVLLWASSLLIWAVVSVEYFVYNGLIMMIILIIMGR